MYKIKEFAARKILLRRIWVLLSLEKLFLRTARYYSGTILVLHSCAVGLYIKCTESGTFFYFYSEVLRAENFFLETTFTIR